MTRTGRALVTGLAGFTGGYLRPELERDGYEVVGIGNVPSGTPDMVAADLTDPAAVAEAVAEIAPSVVVHLAAIAHVGHGDANAFYAVNLVGTRNLLAALDTVPGGPDCVVLASSANIYGNRTAGAMDEETVPDPVNDYAVSKLAMEQMARLWADRLPLVVTRPFNYTGVGQPESFLIPKIVAHFRARAAGIELGNLDVYRDFSDVRAVARAYAGLVAARPIGQTVNICSGNAYSPRDIIGMCEALSGHSLEVSVNPAFARANEVNRLFGDPGRLRALVPDWQPIALADTLRWMLEA